jgi:hypothetical protein
MTGIWGINLQKDGRIIDWGSTELDGTPMPGDTLKQQTLKLKIAGGAVGDFRIISVNSSLGEITLSRLSP